MRMRFGYTVGWVRGKNEVELRMEGASRVAWWDHVVLPSLVGGCVPTG